MIRLLAAQETKSYTYFHNLPLLHPWRSSPFPSCTWPLQHYHNPPGFACTSCLQQLMGFSMKAGAEIVSPWQQPLPHLLFFLDLEEQRWTLLSRNIQMITGRQILWSPVATSGPDLLNFLINQPRINACTFTQHEQASLCGLTLAMA